MLDLMEGRLTPQEEAALHLFLEQNPDLDDSIPTLHPIESTGEHFEFKEDLLFEEVTENNRGFFFISAAEGVLDKQQTEKLYAFLRNFPQYQKEFDQYKRAILVAENITFAHKNDLIVEQEKGIIISLRPLRYIAAAIALFIMGYVAIQVFKTDINPLYTPREIALEKEMYTPENEVFFTPEVHKLSSEKEQNNSITYSKRNDQRSLLPVQKHEEQPSVDLNIAINGGNTEKPNDSIVKPSLEAPTNNDVATNADPIELPLKPRTQTKAPTIGELLVQNAKDKLYNNPNSPNKDDFDSEIAALASAGMSAVSNKEQYINRNVNDAKRTKVSIGGFSFERVRH